MSDKPIGKRFTHVYIDRGKPTDDSPRMRTRLGSVLDALGEHNVSEAAERKLGIQTPWSINQNWRQLLPEWRLEDVLDIVTIAHGQIVHEEVQARSQYGISRDAARKFLVEVQEIFNEENVHYQVDVQGGVHHKLDAAFAVQKAATIASLQGQRYDNARHEFDRAMEEIAKPVPNGKHAIRAVFTATEGLFRLMHPDCPRLAAGQVVKLEPIIKKLMSADAAALRAAMKSLDAFKDWVDAAHNYRHEPGTPEVAQPPLSLAVHLVSTGAAHLRWLAELDQAAG
jgi:hypothetical protein